MSDRRTIRKQQRAARQADIERLEKDHRRITLYFVALLIGVAVLLTRDLWDTRIRVFDAEVVDTHGRPVPGAEVEWRAESKSGRTRASGTDSTDSSGHLRIYRKRLYGYRLRIGLISARGFTDTGSAESRAFQFADGPGRFDPAKDPDPRFIITGNSDPSPAR
jgi:hypothetical protein